MKNLGEKIPIADVIHRIFEASLSHDALLINFGIHANGAGTPPD